MKQYSFSINTFDDTQKIYTKTFNELWKPGGIPSIIYYEIYAKIETALRRQENWKAATKAVHIPIQRFKS